MPYRLVSTSHFDRDYKSLAKWIPEAISHVEAMEVVLREDPYNRSGEHNIKKLKGVKKGKDSGASPRGSIGSAMICLARMLCSIPARRAVRHTASDLEK